MSVQAKHTSQRMDWQELINQIKGQVPFSQVIRDFSQLELKRRGKRLFGTCPFHADSDPSFVVFEEKNRAKCFGCGWTGDQINFVRTALRVSFKEAIEVICRQYRIPFAGMTTQEYLKAKARAESARCDRELEKAFNSKVERVYKRLCDAFRAIDRNLGTLEGLEEFEGLTHIADVLEVVLDELISDDTKRQVEALRYSRGVWGTT